MSGLEGWENFYVIVGSSAGALIGLQFVVMALVAEYPMRSDDGQAGEAFGTPNVVHFGVVLLLSALITAPWDGIGVVAILWGLIGLCGIVYSCVVARRMRSQTAYKPVLEDWLFHVLLPLAGYAMLVAAAGLTRFQARAAMFLVGAGVLLLLFIGIHNSWDTVMYHVFVRRRQRRDDEGRE